MPFPLHRESLACFGHELLTETPIGPQRQGIFLISKTALVTPAHPGNAGMTCHIAYHIEACAEEQGHETNKPGSDESGFEPACFASVEKAAVNLDAAPDYPAPEIDQTEVEKYYVYIHLVSP